MAPVPFKTARAALSNLAGAVRSTASPAPSPTVEPPAAVEAYGPEDAVAVICADDGMVVYASEAWGDLLGYSHGELLGRHVSEVVAQGDESAPGDRLRAISSALRRTGIWHGQMHSLRRDGGRLRCSAGITEADDDRHGRVWVIQVIPFDAELPSQPFRRASRASHDGGP